MTQAQAIELLPYVGMCVLFALGFIAGQQR